MKGNRVEAQESLARWADVTGGGLNTVLVDALAKIFGDKDPHGLTGIEFYDYIAQKFLALFSPILPTAGLGTPTKDDPVALPLTKAYQNFVNSLVSSSDTLATFSSNSALWRLGYSIAQRKEESIPRTMLRRIYEISYCDEGKTCGPGLASKGSQYQGIHPFLYFDLNSSTTDGLNLIRAPMETDYTPATWLPLLPAMKNGT